MNGKFGAGLVGLGVGALLLMSTVFGSFYTVDQGEVALVLRNGALVNQVGAGLHWKMPFVDEAVHMSVREQTIPIPMDAYSKDQQNAAVKVSVNYRLDPSKAGEVYSTFGTNYVTPTVEKQVPKRFKEEFGMFTAERIVSERTLLGAKVESAIRDSLDNTGVIVESVQIEDVAFSNEYEASIENRMKAEVEKSRAVAVAEARRTTADAAAYEVEAAARAAANATKMQGEAEAEAIRAKGRSLRESPALVELSAIEKWDGTLPTQMIPGSTVPFVNIAR